MKKKREITQGEARLVGNCLYLDWEQVDLEEFRQGLMGYRRVADGQAASTFPEVVQAGRAVLSHMEQFPDYFIRLARLRAEVRAKAARRKPQSSRQAA